MLGVVSAKPLQNTNYCHYAQILATSGGLQKNKQKPKCGYSNYSCCFFPRKQSNTRGPAVTGPLDYNILILIILGGKYRKLEGVASSEALQLICSSGSDKLSEEAIGISRMLRVYSELFHETCLLSQKPFFNIFCQYAVLQYLWNTYLYFRSPTTQQYI